MHRATYPPENTYPNRTFMGMDLGNMAPLEFPQKNNDFRS